MDVNWNLLMWAGGIYSLLAAVWVFMDSAKRKLPRKKWAVSALVFPLIVPYYLKRTRPRTALRYILLWGGGFFLCYSGVAQLAGPEEDQTAKTAVDLYRRSRTSLSRVMEDLRAEPPAGRFDAVSQMDEALERVALQTEALSGADACVDEFLTYLAQHEDRLRAENREGIVLLKEIFGDEFRSHQRGIRQYLDARREWLEYSRANYGAVLAREEPQNSVYEELYAKWEKGQASLKTALVGYRAFLKDWIAQHPEVSREFTVSDRILGDSGKDGS